MTRKAKFEMLDTPARRVVVVGGGYAGLTAAVRLSEAIDKGANIQVTLISKNAYLDARPEIDSVVALPSSPDFARMWLPALIADKNIDFHVGTMVDLNRDTKSISVVSANDGKTTDFSYDELILATGAVAKKPPIPGIRDNAISMWGVEDSYMLRHRIEATFNEAIVEPDKNKRRELLTFAVIGAGLTGVEIVGPLAQTVKRTAIRRGIDPEEVRVHIIDVFPVLSTMSQDVSERAIARLNDLGVVRHIGALVSEYNADSNTLTLMDGTSLMAHVIVTCTGAQGDPQAAAWGLPVTACDGRILADQTFHIDGFPDVYAIGDTAAIIGPDGAVIPLLAQHAMNEGKLVAKNIVAKLSNKKESLFKAPNKGIACSIGDGFALATVAGRTISGKPAQAIKRYSFRESWVEFGGSNYANARGNELDIMKKYNASQA